MECTAELGEDLAALVRAVGRPLSAATPLSRRGALAIATAFRLHFADGTVLKGSRLVAAADAARVAALAADLRPLVPRVVASGGAALLSEWVDGESLVGVDWPDELLRRCGAAQAQVHVRAVPADDPSQAAQRSRRQVVQWLDALAESGVLLAGERAALAELAARHAPAACATGISLGDYCADNIVCRASGEPCLIDLETLAIAPSDYDLGRTWYRWPMSAAQRAAYLDGYGAHRDASTFLAHLPFWHIAAMAEGALFRHRERRPDLGVPVAGLRGLLRDASP
ncbi:MAG TPA: aminoglycoside phosphotransferase family protein [Candidatus Dormibacteraeota bacterium]|nr:aminoglycoside phosphotransferase family protein [Candidatus Dormibacteraeota bacterium]